MNQREAAATTAIGMAHHGASSVPMTDGLSVCLVRRSGIPCRTACRTRLLAGTVSVKMSDVSVRNVLMHSVH